MRSRQYRPSRNTSQIFAARAAGRVEMIAFYGAFALIAAVVFGTLSVHPF